MEKIPPRTALHSPPNPFRRKKKRKIGKKAGGKRKKRRRLLSLVIAGFRCLCSSRWRREEKEKEKGP